MRIKSIDLSCFRGAAESASLDADCKSMVVYGVNGSGKSRFVDAIEYVLSDGKIGHLAHEYSGKHLKRALPNTQKPKAAKTSLAVKLSDGATVKIEIEDDGTALTQGSIGVWDYRRTVLRQDEVVDFIQDTKGAKYSALLPLFGLHQMEIAAENLRQLAKNIESLAAIATRKAVLNAASNKRNAIFGKDSEEDILKKVEGLHTAYCSDKRGTTDGLSRCANVMAALDGRIGRLTDDQKWYLALRAVAEINLRSPLNRVRTANASLAGTLDPLTSQRLTILEHSEIFVGKVPLVACRRVTITGLLASELSWLLAMKSCSPGSSIPI